MVQAAWWWRFNGPARIAASFGGAALFCLIVVGPKLLAYFDVAWAGKLIIPWYWQTLLVMGLTTALWVAVALFTKPDPEEMLRSFYLRVHPLGCWTPFKGLDKPTADSSFKPVFKGIFIALVGAASTSFFILGLTHAWFARYLTGTITILLSIISFFIF